MFWNLDTVNFYFNASTVFPNCCSKYVLSLLESCIIHAQTANPLKILSTHLTQNKHRAFGELFNLVVLPVATQKHSWTIIHIYIYDVESAAHTSESLRISSGAGSTLDRNPAGGAKSPTRRRGPSRASNIKIRLQYLQCIFIYFHQGVQYFMMCRNISNFKPIAPGTRGPAVPPPPFLLRPHVSALRSFGSPPSVLISKTRSPAAARASSLPQEP